MATPTEKSSIVKVAGLWEQGWSEPSSECNLWEYPLRDFNVDQFYMCPKSGHFNRFLNERDDIQQVLDENQDLEVVWVDETGKIPLKDFVHPENVLYILGRTTTRPMVQFGRKHDQTIRIETKKDGSNNGMLWAHQAISIVLYDRLNKSWQ